MLGKFIAGEMCRFPASNKNTDNQYIINKSLIIPTEDLRPTSFGTNDIDNIGSMALV
jgi:hypothetical protein